MNIKKNFILYAIAILFSGSTSFILLPIITSKLTQSQFGSLSTFFIFNSVFSSFACLCTQAFISVKWFKTNEKSRKKYILNSLFIILLMHILLSINVLIFNNYIISYFNINSIYIYFSLISSFVYSLLQLFLVILRCNDNAIIFLILKIIQFFFDVLLCVILLNTLINMEYARMVSYLASISIITGLAFIVLSKNNYIKVNFFNFNNQKEILSFGLRLMPHSLGGMLLFSLDRLVLGFLLGQESVGLFMAVLQISMIVSALNEPFNKAFTPWLFNKLNCTDKNISEILVKKIYKLILFGIIIIFFIYIITHVLFNYIVGENFLISKMLLPFMFIGFIFQFLYGIFINFVIYSEKTHLLSIITVTTLLLSFIISYQFILNFGLVGASYSFMLSNFILFALVFMLSRKVYYLPWFNIYSIKV